jgi:hypothetical protein
MTPGILDFLGGLRKTDVIPTIDRTFDRLEIRYKWADSKAERMAGILNIIKGCIFLIPIAFFSNVMLGDGGDPLFLVFLTPFFGIIAFFVYFGAATLLNHGTIIVDSVALVSSDGPLPLNLTKKVSTPDIKRVYASYIVKQAKHGSYKIHLVRVMTKDGHDRIVDKGISETNAQLFATEISKHLRLAEEPFGLDLATVTKEPGRLAIDYRSKENATSSNLGVLLFALLWSGFVVAFFLLTFSAGPVNLIIIPTMLPFAAIGVYLLYYSTGRMRNRSSIIIDQGTLVAKERPLPFTRTKRLSVEEVQEFIASTPDTWSQPNQYRLDALTKKGKYASIARGLSEEQAFMFVQEINDFLGVKVRAENWPTTSDPQILGEPIRRANRSGMPTSTKLFIAIVAISMISIIGFFAIMMSGVFESQESGGLRITAFDAYSHVDHIEYFVTIENTIDTEVTKTLKLTLNYDSGGSNSFESQFQTVTLTPYETRTYTFTIYHYCNGSETVNCSFWNM